MDALQDQMARMITGYWVSQMVLRNVRAAMKSGAKLLVVEYVLPPRDAPSFGKLLDLNMLLLTGGVERTDEEFGRLFDAPGFRLTRVVPTAGGLCVVEGEPKT